MELKCTRSASNTGHGQTNCHTWMELCVIVEGSRHVYASPSFSSPKLPEMSKKYQSGFFIAIHRIMNTSLQRGFPQSKCIVETLFRRYENPIRSNSLSMDLRLLGTRLLLRQVLLVADDKSTGERPSYCEGRIFCHSLVNGGSRSHLHKDLSIRPSYPYTSITNNLSLAPSQAQSQG